jgi:IS30 family transposase
MKRDWYWRKIAGMSECRVVLTDETFKRSPGDVKTTYASDRTVLAHLLELKVSKVQIALRLGVHRSTVFRELRRNSGPIGYIAQEAQSRTNVRRWIWRKRKMDDAATREYVCRHLQEQWSPDETAGRLRRELPRSRRSWFSRQTIYAWIQKHRDEGWRECLRFGKARRRRSGNQGQLPNAVSIDGRPRVVDLRRRFGDWEGDTIPSRGRRGGLVSLVERKSGYTLLARVDNLRAPTVREALERQLAPLPSSLRRTATFDNGKEFAEHERLAEAVDMQIYFAKPYCAWQRGTNENTNSLVRQYWPKGYDLTAESHGEVVAVRSLLNDRPRRRLGYRTPREVLAKHLARRGVAFAI